MITPFYAAILGLFFVYLCIRVIKQRRASKTAIGDGDNIKLSRAIRVQANFSEYVPFVLLLLFLLESRTGSSILIHFFATMLIIGRGVHAYGVSQVKENLKFRVFGMVLTFAVIIGLSIRLILTYIF